MNNTTLQSLISDRDRTAQRLAALESIIAVYQGEIEGKKVAVRQAKGQKMSAARRRAIARGLRRRARRLRQEQKRGNNGGIPMEQMNIVDDRDDHIHDEPVVERSQLQQ